jgi:alpha-N-acetylglucosamine transferase
MAMLSRLASCTNQKGLVVDLHLHNEEESSIAEVLHEDEVDLVEDAEVDSDVVLTVPHETCEEEEVVLDPSQDLDHPHDVVLHQEEEEEDAVEVP